MKTLDFEVSNGRIGRFFNRIGHSFQRTVQTGSRSGRGSSKVWIGLSNQDFGFYLLRIGFVTLSGTNIYRKLAVSNYFKVKIRLVYANSISGYRQTLIAKFVYVTRRNTIWTRVS